MTKFRLLLLTLLLAVTAGRTAAQRCLPGMKGVQFSADMVDGFYSTKAGDGTGYAFSLAFFNYVKGGNKWVYGVEYVRRNCRYRTVGVPMEQYTADAGYFHNLLSSPGKVFFLNAGLSGVVGYEEVNGGRRTLYDGASLSKCSAFIYGCAATLEAEVFITDNIAAAARLRGRALWGGASGVFHCLYGVSLKYVF
ncbi:MAG TPA: conjugal transfer protein TraO [Candidatus Prevotella stercoripullorum]|nr:conjugal transfer protein TraO [Candidatus Prevotella stercoripullorum]